MLTVELQSVPEGRHEYEPVASLTIDSAGTYRLEDPEGQFPLKLHVLVVDHTERDVQDAAGAKTSTVRKVRFEEDPETWARNLHSILRTGYLVPVITRDDAYDVAAEEGEESV